MEELIETLKNIKQLMNVRTNQGQRLTIGDQHEVVSWIDEMVLKYSTSLEKK